MRQRWNLCVIAAMAAACVGPAALAAPDDFRPCDGYEAPGRKADGITTGTWLFGLASATTEFRRDTAHPIGETGISACRRALADPILLDIFWIRRAHLLQAMAFHQLAADKSSEALESLSQSDAIGAVHGDRFFVGSIGLSNKFLRAIALYRLGRRADARAILASAEQKRPLSISLQTFVRAIRLTYEPDLKTHIQELRRTAPLDPRLIRLLFYITLFSGDFKAADEYAEQISFEIPRGHGNWKVEGEDERKYELIVERARFSATRAYVKLALGDRAASKALIAQARSDIADAIEPPVPAQPGDKIGKRAQLDFNLREVKGGLATNEVDLLERSIALREAVTGKSLRQALAILEAVNPRDILTPGDLLGVITPASPDEVRERAALIAEVGARNDADRRKVLATTIADLVGLLPRPETATMLPKMRRQGDGIIRNDTNGYRVRRTDGTDLVTVIFGSEKASHALVEEGAMLAAARYAASLGKDSFLIDSMQLLQRTTNISGLYYGGSYLSGYESRLGIIATESGALPADLAPDRWRLFRVADVTSALESKFPSKEQPAAPR